MSAFTPRVRRTPQNTQCLYTVDSRVHAVQAYPILSPQGATIFLYGHENGVTVVWRGGRRLKRASKPDAKKQPSNDAVMVLDSDSDDGAAPASAAFVDKPVFENALPVADPADGGFPQVQQTLDLALGTAVLHIAVLPLPPTTAKNAEPSFLQEQMVFVVTCATADVHVVTLPLTPPSHECKERLELYSGLLAGNAGRGAFGERLIPLGGQSRPANGVAVTLAKQNTLSAHARSAAAAPTSIVVAACSREASGTLRLWDVTLGAKRTTGASSSERPLEPFQTEFLPRPLAGVTFNPTHPTQLLVVSPQDAVRIYDYTIPSIPSDDVSEASYPPQGSWLLSLYPPFARSQTSTAVRKPIVSAAWIAHGHAVLVLLADGQWGIWDIDRASSGTAVFGGRSTTSGVRGAALTAFSVSGQIEGTSPLRNPTAATRKSAEGEFVPMTPHTRRDALASTFSGRVEGLVALRGGVEVVQHGSVRGSANAGESAVLWLGGSDYIVAVIPDVARFWDAQLRGADGGVNLFSNRSRPARMVRLMELNTSLMGERCCGVCAVASVAQSSSSHAARHSSRTGDDSDSEDDRDYDHDELQKKLPLEVLLQGESRLVVVRETSEQDASVGDFNSRLVAASRKRHASGSANTALVIEPRIPRKPSAGVTFNLEGAGVGRAKLATGGSSLRGASGSKFEVRPGTGKSLFEAPSRAGPAKSQLAAPSLPDFDRSENEVTFTQSMMVPPASQHQHQQQSTAAKKSGLSFLGSLEEAANASDDEEAANERNVEEEMLNIMEIDQALEAMEGQHGTDSQTVFFEGE